MCWLNINLKIDKSLRIPITLLLGILTVLTIIFSYQGNAPELITPKLSEEIAIENAIEFTNNIKKFPDMKMESICKFTPNESPDIHKTVLFGIPYYQVLTGICYYPGNPPMIDYGLSMPIIISVDGIKGEDISLVDNNSCKYPLMFPCQILTD